jgi:hypothetical protein
MYGAGFYYIPGTDMCLKIGGWTRMEVMGYYNGSTTTTMTGNVNNNNTNNILWRARGYITADSRNQSDYGTIRSYIAVGVSTTDIGLTTSANTFSSNRAFVQLAGFTFGLSQSFYDFYSQPATSLTGAFPASDTGDPGWMVAGYTAQFGNGWSATLAAEVRRMSQIINTNIGPLGSTTGGTIVGGSFGNPASFTSSMGATDGAYGGNNSPDIVGNLRVDQAWGSAQIMGALHEVNANYYSTAAGAIATTGTQINTFPGLENSGHPSTAWGFAVGGGAKILTPFIAPGDYFQFQVNYTQGAERYANFNVNGNWYVQNGQKLAYGVLSDAVYGGAVGPNAIGSSPPGTATSLQLTTAWGINAAYEHFWNKQWRTSVVGGYFAVNYNSQANAMLCSVEGNSLIPGVAVTTTPNGGNSALFANGSGFGTQAVAAGGCNNNWNDWWLGTRTQWNVTPDTYFALELMYQRMQSATSVNGIVPTGGNVLQSNGSIVNVGAGVIPGATATTGQSIGNNDNWFVRFRVHKDFYP